MDNDAPTLFRPLAAPAARAGAVLGLVLLSVFVLWIAAHGVRHSLVFGELRLQAPTPDPWRYNPSGNRAAMSLASGTRLGPYEVLALIGAGGMGEVYKARDTRLDRTVAIKVLPPDFAADPERRQRFEREAKTISALNGARVGSATRVFELFDMRDTGGLARMWDVAPDGEHFLVAENTRVAQINVVTNWFEELKAKVPTGR